MLGEKLVKHGSRVWLINTGWTGGPYGTGSRINIADTRALVHAALNGELDGLPTYRDENFGLDVPQHVPGVSDSILHPRDTWQDPAAYDVQARRLASMFEENFRRNFASTVDSRVSAAGPHYGGR